ncbi:hypothetical protein JCM12178A_11290 [Salidesulfovibrio brasiliensis]
MPPRFFFASGGQGAALHPAKGIIPSALPDCRLRKVQIKASPKLECDQGTVCVGVHSTNWNRCNKIPRRAKEQS